MIRTTGSIPKRCAVAILAASLEISGVTAAILSLPIVAYAGNDTGIYEISHINTADNGLFLLSEDNSFQSIGTYVVSTASGDALVQIGLNGDDTENMINYTISSNDNVDFDMIHTYFKTIMRLTHSLQSH